MKQTKLLLVAMAIIGSLGVNSAFANCTANILQIGVQADGVIVAALQDNNDYKQYFVQICSLDVSFSNGVATITPNSCKAFHDEMMAAKATNRLVNFDTTGSSCAVVPDWQRFPFSRAFFQH